MDAITANPTRMGCLFQTLHRPEGKFPPTSPSAEQSDLLDWKCCQRLPEWRLPGQLTICMLPSKTQPVLKHTTKSISQIFANTLSPQSAKSFTTPPLICRSDLARTSLSAELLRDKISGLCPLWYLSNPLASPFATEESDPIQETLAYPLSCMNASTDPHNFLLLPSVQIWAARISPWELRLMNQRTNAKSCLWLLGHGSPLTSTLVQSQSNVAHFLSGGPTQSVSRTPEPSRNELFLHKLRGHSLFVSHIAIVLQPLLWTTGNWAHCLV